MAIKFTPIGWARWIELFVRNADRVRLLGEAGPIEGAEWSLLGAAWIIDTTKWPILTATYPETTWRFKEKTAVAGYEVIDANGEVLWSERFPVIGERPKIDLELLEIQLVLNAEG